jgi:hypothetical protein
MWINTSRRTGDERGVRETGRMECAVLGAQGKLENAAFFFKT